MTDAILPAPGAPTLLTIDDFKKTQLVAAKVLEVAEHPQADRLWVVKLDMGNGVTKQIVAGVRANYSKEELTGKTVIIVNNLKPSVIRGVESNGMMLCAKSADKFTILTVDRDVPPGSTVS